MKNSLLAAIAAALAIGAAASHAQSTPSLLVSTSADADRFRSIGALSLNPPDMASKACTATLVAGSDTPPADARALVVTAGNCAIHDTEVGTVIDQNYSGSFTPGNFMDNQSAHKAYPVSRVVHATSLTRDIALVELEATYGQLLADGFNPARLASTNEFRVRTRLENPQAPTGNRGGWLRLGQCATRAPSQPMALDGDAAYTRWMTWTDCEVPPGAIGSPVLLAGGTDITGIVTNSFYKLRKRGLPAGRNAWFEPVDTIARAIRADSSVDLSTLDPGDGVVLSEGEDHGSSVTVHVSNTSVHTQVRFKAGSVSTTLCNDPAGYSEPQATGAINGYVFAAPADAGIRVLCAVGYNTQKGQWQSFDHPTIRALRGIDLIPLDDGRG